MCWPEMGSRAPKIKLHRHAGRAQRADPAIGVLPALGDVTDEQVHDPASVVAREEFPERAEFVVGGRGVGAKDRAERLLKGALVHGGADERAKWAVQQLLDQSCAVRAGHDAAVQQAEASHAEGEPAVTLAGEEFLRHRVAVVVGEDMGLGDAAISEQRLRKIGLIEDGVGIARGLRREAKADEIRGNASVARRQRGPHLAPIPGRGGEAVQKEQRGALTLVPVKDRMPAVGELSSAVSPCLEIHRYPFHFSQTLLRRILRAAWGAGRERVRGRTAHRAG